MKLIKSKHITTSSWYIMNYYGVVVMDAQQFEAIKNILRNFDRRITSLEEAQHERIRQHDIFTHGSTQAHFDMTGLAGLLTSQSAESQPNIYQGYTDSLNSLTSSLDVSSPSGILTSSLKPTAIDSEEIPIPIEGGKDASKGSKNFNSDSMFCNMFEASSPPSELMLPIQLDNYPSQSTSINLMESKMISGNKQIYLKNETQKQMRKYSKSELLTIKYLSGTYPPAVKPGKSFAVIIVGRYIIKFF